MSAAAGKKSKTGLALSGGGFRATAFHLGVLKRLHELGVLQDVDLMATVSGGSIAGAFWVWWQAIGRHASPGGDAWGEFERRLIRMMRANVRGRVMAGAAILPASIAAALALGACSLLGFGPAHPGSLATAAVASAVCGYAFWTLFSGRLLTWHYDRFLFHGAHLTDVAAARDRGQTTAPQLFVMATAIETAQQILFTERERKGDLLLDVTRRLPVIGVLARGFEYLRSLAEQDKPLGVPRRSLWRSEAFARAVAASSAVPGVFPPVPIGSAFESFAAAMRRRFPEKFGAARAPVSPLGRERYLAVDGGVFDNQGIQALLEQSCDRIIVSDASAPLLPISRLRTQGSLRLLRRSQDIIYARVRELEYAHLRLLAQFHRAKESLRTARGALGKSAPRGEGNVPPLAGFWSIALDVPRDSGSRLPTRVREAVAAIRTDLDRFSDEELAALMYAGYVTADRALKETKPPLPVNAQPLRTTVRLGERDIDWTERKEGEIRRALNHLRASSHRFASIRIVRRVAGAAVIWIAERGQLTRAVKWAVDAWRWMSPFWERVESGRMTIQPKEGESVEITLYGWRRRHPLGELSGWLRRSLGRIRGGKRGPE